MKKTIWNPTLAWLAAVTAALLLAFVSPNESSLMGSLPMLTAKRLDQQQMILPYSLLNDRTLVLVAFRREQRDEIQGWINGLQLNQDSSISWFKMPVLN